MSQMNDRPKEGGRVQKIAESAQGAEGAYCMYMMSCHSLVWCGVDVDEVGDEWHLAEMLLKCY